MKLVIDDIALGPERDPEGLPGIVAAEYGLSSLTLFRLLRRSMDARKKSDIVYRYRVLIEVEDAEGERLLEKKEVSPWSEVISPPAVKKSFAVRPVIVEPTALIRPMISLAMV